MWGGRMDQYAAATVNRRLAAISGLFAFVAMRDPRPLIQVVVRDLAAWRSRTWSGHRVILLGCVDASGSSGGRGPQRRGRRVGGRERQAAGSYGRPVCRTGATFWSMVRRSSFGRWVLGVHDHWEHGPTQRTLLAWRALPRGLRRSGCRIRAMSPTVSLGRPIGAVLEGWQVKMAALSCTCRGRQSKRFADVVDRLAPNRSHGT